MKSLLTTTLALGALLAVNSNKAQAWNAQYKAASSYHQSNVHQARWYGYGWAPGYHNYYGHPYGYYHSYGHPYGYYNYGYPAYSYPAYSYPSYSGCASCGW